MYIALITVVMILMILLVLVLLNPPITTGVRDTIYCFWTGDNEMTASRKESLENLKNISECDVVLITKRNLNPYILEEHPLHPAYQYLSETHKSDYLRTYFMNFHGGGYSDIKKTSESWKSSFELLRKSDKWMCGYAEIEGGVGYAPNADKWRELIGNGAYICKPQTPLTKEWYRRMISLLDLKLEDLHLWRFKTPIRALKK
jgi:hypothetical protein